MADQKNPKAPPKAPPKTPLQVPKVTGYGLTPQEQKMRNKRNLAIAFGLVGFVVIVFLVTILRLGASVADRSF